MKNYLERALRLIRREKQWTILLAIDAETEFVGNNLLLTSKGKIQATKCTKRILELTPPGVTPQVWCDKSQEMHAITARVLSIGLGGAGSVHNWAPGAYHECYDRGDPRLTLLAQELERSSPTGPVVIVLLASYTALLLLAAGIKVQYDHDMLPDRVYPLTITSSGRVKRSPLVNLRVDAPELAPGI